MIQTDLPPPGLLHQNPEFGPKSLDRTFGIVTIAGGPFDKLRAKTGPQDDSFLGSKRGMVELT